MDGRILVFSLWVISNRKPAFIYIFNVAKVLFMIWLLKKGGVEKPHNATWSVTVHTDSQVFRVKAKEGTTLGLCWFERTCIVF